VSSRGKRAISSSAWRSRSAPSRGSAVTSGSSSAPDASRNVLGLIEAHVAAEETAMLAEVGGRAVPKRDAEGLGRAAAERADPEKDRRDRALGRVSQAARWDPQQPHHGPCSLRVPFDDELEEHFVKQ